MNYMSERDEIAGTAEQNLPTPDLSAISSANAGGTQGGDKAPLAFSWRETPSEEVAVAVLSTKAPEQGAPPTETAPANVPVSAPLDRLEQMVFRQVVDFRQAGAQSLGVTLRVDAQTQLFLQLTTSNGQVRASVRCERGSFIAQDSQWAAIAAIAGAAERAVAAAGQRPCEPNFRAIAGQPAAPSGFRRQNRPAEGAAVEPAPIAQTETTNISRKNWESWA